MPFLSPDSFNASSFSLFKNSLLQQDELPLAEALQDQRFLQAFDEHGIEFGNDDDAVYTPAITLWALISQVFYKEEQRSCKAAVARVATLWALLGRRVCSTNTGAYCRARAKLPDQLLRTLTQQVAQDAQDALPQPDVLSPEQADEQCTPGVVAQVKAKPRTGRLLLVDGFTITAADTPANQAEYPQHPNQQEGLGFPILRCVSLISLETGLLVDLACGRYSGKESGETALLWQLLDSLQEGDIVVADSLYCSYWLVGACQLRGVQVVMKNHHLRPTHPQEAIELDPRQRLVGWQRPPRPDWMSQEDYHQQPASLSIRLVDVDVEDQAVRPEALTVATTLLDHVAYPREWIGSVYGSRWLVELDIRSIKCSLGMDILRAKSPERVRAELWSCLLAYNWIRLKMLQGGVLEGRDARSVSFTTSLQSVATNWLVGAVVGWHAELALVHQRMACSELVGHREGRIEPRENKRRPKVLVLMTRPRAVRRAELTSAA